MASIPVVEAADSFPQEPNTGRAKVAWSEVAPERFVTHEFSLETDCSDPSIDYHVNGNCSKPIGMLLEVPGPSGQQPGQVPGALVPLEPAERGCVLDTIQNNAVPSGTTRRDEVSVEGSREQPYDNSTRTTIQFTQIGTYNFQESVVGPEALLHTGAPLLSIQNDNVPLLEFAWERGTNLQSPLVTWFGSSTTSPPRPLEDTQLAPPVYSEETPLEDREAALAAKRQQSPQVDTPGVQHLQKRLRLQAADEEYQSCRITDYVEESDYMSGTDDNQEPELANPEESNFWVDRDTLDVVLLPIRDAIDGSMFRIDYLLQQTENLQYDQEKVQSQWDDCRQAGLQELQERFQLWKSTFQDELRVSYSAENLMHCFVLQEQLQPTLKNLQQEYLQIAASLQRTQTSEAARMDVFSAQLQPILDQFPQVLSSLTHLEGSVGTQQNFLQIAHREEQHNNSVTIPDCERLQKNLSVVQEDFAKSLQQLKSDLSVEFQKLWSKVSVLTRGSVEQAPQVALLPQQELVKEQLLNKLRDECHANVQKALTTFHLSQGQLSAEWKVWQAQTLEKERRSLEGNKHLQSELQRSQETILTLEKKVESLRAHWHQQEISLQKMQNQFQLLLQRSQVAEAGFPHDFGGKSSNMTPPHGSATWQYSQGAVNGMFSVTPSFFQFTCSETPLGG